MLSCDSCDTTDVEIVDSNGVTDPESTRVEIFECGNGHRFSRVLSPHA